ncbi:uncharacterized protein LOC124456338 [Xenia sp. Carnegie-2017]|uniref:uncharacterized protein LOC124456338 n=1 Tax=Xenia sp. Carnegie-2017 TaxID=2897299 RepID=UPI001F03CC3B|nr:uncharacterized protein LOC124456338 [Xenia sp. Carnegie-2017]
MTHTDKIQDLGVRYSYGTVLHNAIDDEGKLEDDFSFMDFRDEISKRAPSSAVGIYKSLKHSFISLAKPNAKISVSRRRRSRSWFWSSRRRRFSRVSRRTASSNFNPRKDMVFVMDRSGSVGRHHFNLQKTFIKQLIEYFDISRSKTLVAIVTFASNVKLEFDFNKYPNKECLRNGIKNIRYTGGLTATGPALHYVLNNLIMSHSTGARNPPLVTTSISKTELNSIASKPDFVYYVTNGYSTLSTVIRKLKKGLSTKCKYGKDNCRIRKEFNDLTNVERIRYITTVKTASTISKYKRKYERLLTIHRTIFSGYNIHRKQFFLPWHRWFILQYENLLREIDCRVTVPYWDWSQEAGRPFSSSVWSASSAGLGDDGSPSTNCVKTGPFRDSQWSLPLSSGENDRCLKRRFRGRVPNAAAVKELLKRPSIQFHNFEMSLRRFFHDSVHCNIGGTMCSNNSAFAPEFFLHHGFVDKLWWDWQNKGSSFKFHSYFQLQNSLMSQTSHRPRDLTDLSKQPDCVCVKYKKKTGVQKYQSWMEVL